MKTNKETGAARPLVKTYRALLACICLAAAFAVGCKAQGTYSGEEDDIRPYSITLVTVGQGKVEGIPQSAAVGTAVSFSTVKARDAETVSATFDWNSGKPEKLKPGENGLFSFGMPKGDVTVTVMFSVIFEQDDTAIAEGETLYIKTNTNTTFLISKNNNDWTDAQEGYLENDMVVFNTPSANRAVVITTEANLEPVSPVHVTFVDANLNPGYAPISIKDGAQALITMEGNNTFAPQAHGSAGIFVTPGSTLTLTGPEGASLTATGRSSNSGTAAAGIGGAGYGNSFGQGGDIIITGDLKVTATGGYNAPGIGAGFGTYGGILTIGGNADVTAQGGHGAAGIGGGYDGGGGTIIIQDNAMVRATGSSAAAGGSGIGTGSTNGAQVGVNVTIKDNATVIAIGKLFATGIGGRGKDADGVQITILGNARVYGEAGTTDAAGIGGDDGDNYDPSGAKITIGDGTDNPLVIARGSSGTDNTSMASGLGGGGSFVASKVYIDINSGTVIAQTNRPDGVDIGAQNPTADSYVKITGGTVYAVNTKMSRPYPVGGDGTSLVYPLYAPAGTSGPIRVPFASAVYEAPVFDSRITDFIALCGLDLASVFPGLADIAASLWVPQGEYPGIEAGGQTKTATVNADYPAFGMNLTDNVLK